MSETAAVPGVESERVSNLRVSRNPATSWDVICIGQTSFDTIHTDKGTSTQRVGGSAYISAKLMAGLGLRIGLVSCWGAPLADTIQARPNLDLAGVLRRPEPAVHITLKYERQQLRGLQISDRITKLLTEARIPRNYYRSRFFYLTPAPIKLLCDVAKQALAKGARIVFTPKEDFPSVQKSESMRQLLAKCFMCFVNESELRRLTGVSGTQGISVLRDLGVKTVVATYGSQGAVIATPKETWNVTPPAISKEDDVVGAGDCFAAGMLAALSRNVDLHRASAFASDLVALWLSNRTDQEAKTLKKFATQLSSYGSN